MCATAITTACHGWHCWSAHNSLHALHSSVGHRTSPSTVPFGVQSRPMLFFCSGVSTRGNYLSSIRRDYAGETIHRGGRHSVLYHRTCKAQFAHAVARSKTKFISRKFSLSYSSPLYRGSEWGGIGLFWCCYGATHSLYNATGNLNVNLW
jgi:hypothetical protein